MTVPASTENLQPALAAGGVVYFFDEAGTLHILLIQDRFGFWTMPKGHIDPGETEQETAQREIQEETTVRCTIEDFVHRIRYSVYRRGSLLGSKDVSYYLARAERLDPPSPLHEEGISAAQWFEADVALKTIGYENNLQVLRRALAILRKRGEQTRNQVS